MGREAADRPYLLRYESRGGRGRTRPGRGGGLRRGGEAALDRPGRRRGWGPWALPRARRAAPGALGGGARTVAGRNRRTAGRGKRFRVAQGSRCGPCPHRAGRGGGRRGPEAPQSHGAARGLARGARTEIRGRLPPRSGRRDGAGGPAGSPGRARLGGPGPDLGGRQGDLRAGGRTNPGGKGDETPRPWWTASQSPGLSATG